MILYPKAKKFSKILAKEKSKNVNLKKGQKMKKTIAKGFNCL